MSQILFLTTVVDGRAHESCRVPRSLALLVVERVLRVLEATRGVILAWRVDGELSVEQTTRAILTGVNIILVQLLKRLACLLTSIQLEEKLNDSF